MPAIVVAATVQAPCWVLKKQLKETMTHFEDPQLMSHIQQQLLLAYPHMQLHMVDEVDSTNLELLRQIRQGNTAPQILLAKKQTAARGRMGKSWQTNPKTSLAFSLSLPIQTPLDGNLALAVGCVIIEALLHETQKNPSNNSPTSPTPLPTLKMKWPNDIWLVTPQKEGAQQWKKLAGILIETLLHQQQRYAVIGVGVNISSFPQGQPLSPPAGFLQELDRTWTIEKAFTCLAPELVRAMYNFNQEGFVPCKKIFQKHDLLLDVNVQTSTGLEGIGCGINAQGQLLIQTPDGQILPISSGEVSVRPC